jgi:predicted DNA-binding transcriptional regulator AlpA
MNLTIQQVSKLTKLSVPTLYTYASRQKLGKKVGNKRVFSQADVHQLLKGSSKKSPPKKTTKPPARKTSKRVVKRELPKKAKPMVGSHTLLTPTTRKPSAWTRLFFGKRSRE